MEEARDHHLGEHLDLPQSVVDRDLGGERALVLDYAGRAVFELLQNALSPAKDLIVVEARQDGARRQLLVGNDHRPVRFDPEVGRSDFQALCSIHTSNKRAQDDVGNKGVGFRSVFAASRTVSVYSRHEGGWWRLRMVHPTTGSDYPEPLPRAADVHGFLEQHGGQAPSFYFPAIEFDEQAAPPCAAEGLVTVVVLEDLSEEAWTQALVDVELLEATPLLFLSSRARCPEDLRIVLRREGREVRRGLDASDWITARRTFVDPDRLAQARRCGLDLEQIELMVAVPRSEIGERPLLLYSYLPTEMNLGFGACVHGDFYLVNSRRGAVFSGGEPGEYNRWLLQQAARLLVDELWEREEVLLLKDFWRLCTPSAEASVWRQEMAAAFAPWADDGRRWSRTIERSFPQDQAWPLRRWSQFWHAVNAWGETAYRLGYGGWGATSKALVDVIRGVEGARVIPVVTPDWDERATVQHAVAIPGRVDGRRTASVFHQKDETESLPALPDALRERGLVVTAFTPPAIGVDRAHMTTLAPMEILSRIPVDLGEEPWEVLRWLLALAYRVETGSSQHRESFASRARIGEMGPVWNLVAEERSYRENVRDRLQRIPLPAARGGWRPAAELFDPPAGLRDEGRILTEHTQAVDVVDRERLAQNISADDVDQLLNLLGVGPCPGLEVTFGEERITAGLRVPVGDLDERGRIALARLMNGGAPRFAAPIVGCRDRSHVAGLLRAFEDAIADERWLPAEELACELPEGLNSRLLCAREIWLASQRGGFRSPLIVQCSTRQLGQRALLRMCGCTRLEEGARSHRLKACLEDVQRRYPDAGTESQRLVQLVRRLFRLGEPRDLSGAPHLCLDVETGYRWIDPETDPVYLPLQGYGGYLDCFPGLRFSVLREQDVSRLDDLGLRRFKPMLEIEASEDGEEDAAMKRSLLPHVGPLIAIASTLLPSLPDETELRRRWNKLRLVRVTDAWLQPILDGVQGEPIGKGTFNDALWKADDHTIVFDIGDREQLGGFARALSQALLGNVVVAGPGERYLAAVRSGAGPETLRWLGVSDRESREWRRRVTRWSVDDRTIADISRAIREAAEPLGIIGLDDDVPTRITARMVCGSGRCQGTVEDLEAAFREGLRPIDGGLAFLPEITIEAERRREWDEHRNSRRRHDALVRRILRHPDTDWDDDLRQKWLEEWHHWFPDTSRLDFTPADGLRQWIARSPFAHAGTESNGRNLRAEDWAHGGVPLLAPPNAQAVSAGPLSVAPSDEPLAPETQEARGKRQRSQDIRGASAEIGVLRREMRLIAPILEDHAHAALDAIKAALPDRYHDRITSSAGAQWMHVSSYWGNSGFDVLTLFEVQDRVQPLRIEVKRAVPGNVRIHLSENERRQARRYLHGGVPGSWRLELVLGPGQTYDATPAVHDLLSDLGDDACRRLARGGCVVEGYEIPILTGSMAE